MTFSSKSDDLELPRVGEVWSRHLPGNTPDLWLIVREDEGWLQLLSLESDRMMRYWGPYLARDALWKRFASPGEQGTRDL